MGSLLFKRKQVRLHLYKSDPSIEGVLMERPNGFYRLAKPELVLEQNQNHSLEGEVWVPREHVMFVQVLS